MSLARDPDAFHLHVFGCQMNKLDAELMEAVLM